MLINCDILGLETDKSVRLPKFQMSDKIVILHKFTARVQYGAAMLVYLCTWRPKNGVSVWNLVWLSRRLIICTDQTSIYISTFPNTLTSE